MSELELWNELGNIYFKTGAVDEAIRTYQKVIELNPGCGQSYSILASILAGQDRYAEAIPVIKKGIELMGNAINQAFLWNQLGDTYRKLEDFANSHASYQKAVELDPEDAVYHKNLVEVESSFRVEDNSSDTSEPSPMILGSRILTTATIEEADSRNPDAMDEGNTPDQVTTKVSDEASSLTLKDSRSLDLADGTSLTYPPHLNGSIDAHTHGFLRLGILHWRKGEYERAIQFLKMALDKASRSQNQFLEALSYYAIAQVETDLGKIEDSIQAYQSAANLAPERIFPWNKLGDLYCMLNRFEDARAAFQEGIEHNSKDPISWNGLGDVYHKLGRIEDAIAAYQLGNVFEKQSIEQDALEEFEKAITETTTEALPHSEPFVAETTSQENEGTTTVQQDSTKAGQAQKAVVIPEEVSSPASVVADSEPEAAYWMFKSVNPHGYAKQPLKDSLPMVAEPVESTAKTIHAFGSQIRHPQVFSSNRGLTDSVQEDASILVQLPPRPAAPVRTSETINLSVAKHNWESASEEMDSELRRPCSVTEEIKTGDSAPQAIGTESRPGSQSSLDLQVIEHDIAAYRRVTEINPKNDRAWDALGNMYENVGLHSEAVTAFEQAIALGPEKEVYYYHLGIALAYQKQYDKAIQTLQRVVELNPHYLLAHCALAGYYRRLGKEAEAQEHMKIARPGMEDENEYNQACFESIGGNADRALALLEVALEKHQIQPGMVRSDPDLDFIRNDARFEALLIKNKIISQ